MVISYFIFNDLDRKSNCFCRVRICVNTVAEVCIVLTDISGHITSSSITNSIEIVYESLLLHGFVSENIEIFEHYEDNDFGSFELVTLLNNNQPKWMSYSKEAFCKKYEIDAKLFFAKTESNTRLMSQIVVIAHRQDPFRFFPYSPDPRIVKRRLEIEHNMIKKSDLLLLIEENAAEQKLLKLLKTDLSIFAEEYAHPTEEYICFSEFPIGNVGNVDFALFSGRSQMCVTLIEVKGADFQLLTNRSGYKTFSSKIDIAQKQILEKNGYIYRNYEMFRKEMHKIRRKVERGEHCYNSLLGPQGRLYVDPEKDITIRYVVIGGRTVNDLEESGKRHDFEHITNPPIHLETWDSWLRKLSRQ